MLSRMLASGQFATPQKQATMPTAAAKPGARPSSGPITQPKVAPTKKVGTISPPLYPAPRVRAVRAILSTKARAEGVVPCSTAAVMTPTPAPLYTHPCPAACSSRLARITRQPPAAVRRAWLGRA